MQVLTAMEGKFKNSKYSMRHVKGVLTFDTESVPVQQFQARCADLILQSARHPLSKASLLHKQALGTHMGIAFGALLEVAISACFPIACIAEFK